jgi:hypothetical protein
VVEYTWQAFQTLSQDQPRLLDSAWIPDWDLDRHIAGVGQDGQPLPYYLPDLVKDTGSLRQLVVPEGKAGKWLLQRYTALTQQRDSQGQRQYTFLSVDQGAQQLVVDISALRGQVLGMAHAVLLQKGCSAADAAQLAAAAAAAVAERAVADAPAAAAAPAAAGVGKAERAAAVPATRAAAAPAAGVGEAEAAAAAAARLPPALPPTQMLHSAAAAADRSPNTVDVCKFPSSSKQLHAFLHSTQDPGAVLDVAPVFAALAAAVAATVKGCVAANDASRRGQGADRVVGCPVPGVTSPLKVLVFCQRYMGLFVSNKVSVTQAGV